YTEMILRSRPLQLVEHALHHCGSELLGRQPVSASDYPGRTLQPCGSVHRAFADRGYYVLVQRFAGAEVVEQVISSPRQTCEPVHFGLNNRRGLQIVTVCCFARLKKYVGVLCGASHHWTV